MKTIVRRIGLVAHDAMKKDMIEWVLWNSERLIGHKFYCTGTTGTLIKKAISITTMNYSVAIFVYSRMIRYPDNAITELRYSRISK